MSRDNGLAADRSAVLGGVDLNEEMRGLPKASLGDPLPELATRTKQRTGQQLQQNRFVIVGAGVVVVALLIFVAASMPRTGTANKGAALKPSLAEQGRTDTSDTGVDKSLLPITDSGGVAPKAAQNGFLNERDLERTAKPAPPPTQTTLTAGAGTLGSIAPFGDQNWQAPPYQPGTAAATDPEKAERDALEKPLLIYVRKASPMPSIEERAASRAEPELGLGLAVGTKLRARLESAVSTAVRTPVLAVIEYNYERDGEIIIPAGAKAVGHIREANRSGYVDIEFDSLLIPDGTSLPIDAAAMGLNFKPLKGKVEGKNTGKNILVRSLSGIGQAGSMFVGQNSLNQPLNESDLIREHVSSNVGEAGDEEVSRLEMNQKIVVTVSAGVPIYVVLEQSPKLNQPRPQTPTEYSPADKRGGVDEVHELLQRQKELSENQNNQPAY